MENSIKQIRFFKVLVAVLVMVLLTQFSFWFREISKDNCVRETTNKMQTIGKTGKIAIPSICDIINW